MYRSPIGCEKISYLVIITISLKTLVIFIDMLFLINKHKQDKSFDSDKHITRISR
jgi:hypothetical protein